MNVLVAAAHGTRDPQGPAVLEGLLERVRERLPAVDVRIGYVDVIEPSLDGVLGAVDGPAVVVPMFLASGYHVRVDVPEAVATTGGTASVTTALGPDDAVVAAVAERLRTAGPLPAAVVMAAAGSSDAGALADVEAAGRRLEEMLGRRVVVGYVTTASPSVGDAVASLRAAGVASVGVASYLLAPGLFQRRLADVGADLVASPIGAHESVVDAIVSRYEAAAGGEGHG